MKNLILIVFVIIVASCNTKTSTQSAQLSAQPDTIKTILHVEGMTCDHCEMTVQASVKELDGLVKVKANHVDSTTLVKFDASKTTIEEISKAIEKKGYKVIAEK